MIHLVATVGHANWSSRAHKTVSCRTQRASPRAEPCAGLVWTPGLAWGPEQALSPVASRKAALSANNTEDFPGETFAADMWRVQKSADWAVVIVVTAVGTGCVWLLVCWVIRHIAAGGVSLE